MGEASIEAELRDSQTKERLAAMLDHRVGQKALKGVMHDWADVQSAFEYRAEQLRTRLEEHKGMPGMSPAPSKK